MAIKVAKVFAALVGMFAVVSATCVVLKWNDPVWRLRLARSYTMPGTDEASSKLYVDLCASASASDLISYLDSSRPVLRAEAFCAIVDMHPEVDAPALLLAHLGDAQEIGERRPCTTSRCAVADLHFELVRDRLTPAEQQQFVRWLVTHPNRLMAREYALRHWAVPTDLHDEVRNLIRQSSPGALFALGGFKDPSDVSLIRSQFKSQISEPFEAAERFPHPNFLPDLLSLQSQMNLSGPGAITFYYRAVAAQRNAAAKGVLEASLRLPEHRLREYDVEAAFEAALLHPDPLFDDFLFACWDEERTHSNIPYRWSDSIQRDPEPMSEMVNYLNSRDHDRTVASIKRYCQQEGYFTHEAAVGRMAQVLVDDEGPEQAFADLSKPLVGTCYTGYGPTPLLDMVRKYRPRSAIAPLLSRLRHGEAHLNRGVAAALIVYKELGINAELDTIPSDQK